MSQGILIHTYGERFAWVAQSLVLTGIPRKLAEAAEARANQEFFLSATGRGMVHNVRVGPAHDGTGCMGLDVQVKVEQSVMADYSPRVLRKQRSLWERTQRDTTTNGETSYVDEWELSSAREEGIAY